MYDAIVCLLKACENLKLEYKILDRDENLAAVLINDKYHYFHSNKMPLNSQMVREICVDKEFTYLILKDYVKMPATLGYFNPDAEAKYSKYKHFKSIAEILKDIENNFKFPLIIKKNRGSQGTNVFLCADVEAVEKAAKIIFDPNSRSYDYVMLAQERVEMKKEYRVLVLDGKIELMYLKDNSKAKFTGNLSPLHWDKASAIIDEDQDLKSKIQEFIDPIFKKINLIFAGLDIVEDAEGNLQLIEINSSPAFTHFLTDNGEERIVGIYEKVLMYLMK